jgi:hypothetical protein
MNFPSIGDYNQVIRKQGGNVFRNLKGINLIPSKTSPIKVYLFGSGAFAAVFKGGILGKLYAIRCFISAEIETIDRYRRICDYLKNINATWITDCEFLENEISVNGNTFPVLKMEWVDGLLLNEFVSKNLTNNRVLSQIQEKLISISKDLERNNIGHGDLQCGNIIVTGTASDFEIKLIDYDGMYIPAFDNKKSLEKGRSEFQHPRRTENDFNSEIDRFSFWVIITALEALKHDKTLWQEIMQGGFNTLDNFLFTIQDFTSPNQSKLFNRLYNINSQELFFYIEKLKNICLGGFSSIPPPSMILIDKEIGYQGSLKNQTKDKVIISSDKYKIISNQISTVLTSTFQKIGATPIELEKKIYEGKSILISNGIETKQIKLTSKNELIEITFN